MIEFTGERAIPGQIEADLWNEHIARYTFASRLAAGKRVLDAGCGTGYGSAELSQCAESVVGADISAEAVAYARTAYSRPNLSFVEASCAALPFQSGAIDLAVSFEVIEHIAEWKQFLLELRRVLAPAGVLIISTPNKEYYEKSRGTVGPNPFHVHEFAIDEFHGELAGIFPHVLLFTENHVATIGIEPAGPIEDSRIDVVRPGAVAGEPSTASDVPHYILAICSAQPVPTPAPFLYVPQMANILRNRELHIAQLEEWISQLQSWQATLKQEKEELVDRFRAQNSELEKSNAWAHDLDRQLEAKSAELAKCAVLLDQAERTVIERVAWASDLDRQLEAKSAELAKCAELLEQAERTVIERTAWASDLDRQLEAKSAELAKCAELLEQAERTVIERTAWAQRLDSELQSARTQLEFVKASRWVRLGRKLSIGPDLGNA
jgi:SAM-dependent methyltransferase